MTTSNTVTEMPNAVPSGVTVVNKTLVRVTDAHGKVRITDEDTAQSEQLQAETDGTSYSIDAVQTFGIAELTVSDWASIHAALETLFAKPEQYRDFVNRAIFAKCNSFANNKLKAYKKEEDGTLTYTFEPVDGVYSLVRYLSEPPQREVLTTYAKTERALENLVKDPEMRKSILRQLLANIVEE